jgi:hypothetical protein
LRKPRDAGTDGVPRGGVVDGDGEGLLDVGGRRQGRRHEAAAEVAHQVGRLPRVVVVEDGQLPPTLAERAGHHRVQLVGFAVAADQVIGPDAGLRGVVDRPVPVRDRDGWIDHLELLLEEAQEGAVPRQEGRPHVGGHDGATEGVAVPEDEGVVDA